MAGYTKLFHSILASTIWREDAATRLVWITMLAMTDKRGDVQASVPGLADFARVPVEECRRALAKLMAPDPDSRTDDHEGRRIMPIEGGWRLINHRKYRDKMNADERREYLADKQAEHRSRKKARSVNNQSTEVNNRSDPYTPSTDPYTDQIKSVDQEQPSRTQAGHPSGEEKSTEDQLNANDGREVYDSGRPMLMPLEIATREEFTRMYPAGENPAALTKIAHGVLTDLDNGRIPALDAPGAVKDAAGAAGLAYGGDRVRKALDSAEHRRQRDTPISAALRIAEDVLRQAPGLTLTVPEFHRVIFDRTAYEYGDVPDFADAVRTLLYDPTWPKHDPDHFGFTDTLKDPDTGKRLLKPVVGAYHWKLGANT